MEASQAEELICLIATLQRPELSLAVRAFKGSFPIDFTQKFLDEIPLDRLRHIYLGLCLHNRQMPHAPPVAA